MRIKYIYKVKNYLRYSHSNNIIHNYPQKAITRNRVIYNVNSVGPISAYFKAFLKDISYYLEEPINIQEYLFYILYIFVKLLNVKEASKYGFSLNDRKLEK